MIAELRSALRDLLGYGVWKIFLENGPDSDMTGHPLRGCVRPSIYVFFLGSGFNSGPRPSSRYFYHSSSDGSCPLPWEGACRALPMASWPQQARQQLSLPDVIHHCCVRGLGA